MKKQIIGGLFALVALFFTVVSCRKDVQTAAEPTQAKSTIDAVKGDFHVENGILHFDNAQAFSNVLDQLRKFDISERRNFGVNLGFYSYLNGYSQVLDRSAAAAEDDKGYDDFLRENTDIINLRADGTFSMRILNKSLASVLNREGIVYIGKDVYRFTDWGEAIASDGDIDRLRTISAKTPSSENISVFAETTLQTRTCGSWLMQNGVLNPHGTNAGDFWCGIEHYAVPSYDLNGFRLYNSNGQPLFHHINTSYSIGTPWKKNWRGRWVTFTSNNTLTINQSAISVRQGTVIINGIPSFDECTFSDNLSYSNRWNAIDYNGNGCVMFNALESTNFNVWYLNARNSYEMTSDFVKIDLVCQ